MKRFAVFLSLHLFLFLLVIAYQAQAKEDEWEIGTFQDMIVTSVPGEIVHGDKLRFILKKGNCGSLNVLFSFYLNYTKLKLSKISSFMLILAHPARCLLGRRASCACP